MPAESVDAIVGVCKEASGYQGEVQGGLGFIYPGTKWCGPGEHLQKKKKYFLIERLIFYSKSSKIVDRF